MIEAWKRKRAAEGLLAAFRGGERFPALLFWKVTERQVVRSPYEARPRRDRDELSAYQGQSILQQAADAGTRKVSFTGSDPILWDQFGELLRFAREVGLLTEVTAWGPLIVKKADDLAQAGRVTIPLFGGQRVHDAIVVGNRVYEQAIAGLRALRARDAAVTLEFAPTRKNVSEIEGVLRLAHAARANVRLVAPPLRGRVRERAEPYFPEGEQLRAVVDACLDARRSRPALIRNSRASLETIRRWPSDATRENLAGVLYAAIDPEGNLTTSERDREEDSVGGLRHKPLTDLFPLLRARTPRRSERADALELELLCTGESRPEDAAQAIFD